MTRTASNGSTPTPCTLRMTNVPRSLGPCSALEDVFVDINKSLPQSGINAVFGGCTAVVALVRGAKVWVANAGDSRALVAGRGKDGKIVARGLTRDQVMDCVVLLVGNL